GQAVEALVHISAASHAPALARQVTVGAIAAVSGAQVPLPAGPPAMLQAWQSPAPPAQALLQHTPSAQKPDSHSALRLHAAPRAAAAIVCTRALPALTP